MAELERTRLKEFSEEKRRKDMMRDLTEMMELVMPPSLDGTIHPNLSAKFAWISNSKI